MNVLFPMNFPSVNDMITIIMKISSKSWKNNLTESSINKWLDNFSGKVFDENDERRIALWLLCNFTFYNETEISHLCSVLSNNFLHSLLSDNSQEIVSKDDIDKILKRTIFTQIGKPGESGGIILYYFRQQAQLSIQNFAYLNSIDFNEYDNIVCIDDSILSGNTAKNFFENELSRKLQKNNKVFFLSLFATQIAIEVLQQKNISLIYSILLDSRSQYFSEQSICFSLFKELMPFAKKMSEEYGKDLVNPKYEEPLGYNNGQYNFGMYYNTPNNSLPIFWSNKNNWNPIFLRKEKYYFDKQSNRNYSRFI